MKRLFCILLTVILSLPAVSLAKNNNVDDLPQKLTLIAGKLQTYKLTYTGTWENSNPDVVHVENEVTNNTTDKIVRITALKPGKATLKFQSTKKADKTATIQVTVKKEAAYKGVPEAIQKAVDIALQEWKEVGGNAVPRSGGNKPHRGNKYCVWWGYDVGWCGAFVGYCLDKAGIPMESEDMARKVKPLKTGEPHTVRVAGVPKIHTAFTNMNRTTKIPRPGYLVIYGARQAKNVTAYGFLHVGMVTDVQDRGDGTYVISTVEGNLANTVKRLQYVYTLNSENDNNNMSMLPKDQQTDPDTFKYTLHGDTWYINEFCQTWY